MSRRRNCFGFTITELTLSVAIAGVLALALFTVTFYYYADTMQAQASTDLALDSQNILTRLTEDTRLADAISNTNVLSDPNAPPGEWVTSDPSNVIIIESPAVDSNRNIIYNSDTGDPYRNEYIYFKSGSNMYRRVLANSAATGNTATTTCPASKAGPSCPADTFFSSYISNLSFTFYDSSGNTTSDATQARSVALEIDMTKKVFGKNVTLTNSTRVTLRNK